VLSPIILDSLLIYFKACKPFYRLFARQKGGKYFERSIQHIKRNALLTSGDNPWGTGAILGHSFATNLSLGSINLRIIQNFLGHSNSKITEIYTRITTKEFEKIVNQINKLNLK
jgi:integrase/recombinase XerD